MTVNLMARITLLAASAALLMLATSCASSDALDGLTSLTRIDPEPPGPNCVEGGALVLTGVDKNSDDVLGPDEVTSEALLCNGSDGETGATYITNTSTEPIGQNCSAGGARVDVGLDENGNGELEAEEIVATEYVCNGRDGQAGPQGPAGPTGNDGADGADGADGTNALVSLANEPAGANCAQGGTRVSSGADLNGNGVLDAIEVDATRYVCDGEDGVDGTGAGSPAEVYSTYDPGSINTTSTASITVDSISFTASGAGTAYVVASTDVYCSTANCSATRTDGYLTLTSSSTGSSSSGAYSFFYLTEDRTENFSRSAVFNVTGAGTRTYYLRGSAASGSITFHRPQITVIFFPN